MATEMVQVPAADLKALVARVEKLEAEKRVADTIRDTRIDKPEAAIYTPEWEEKRKELEQPASVRTQKIADRKYGTKGKRFRAQLDSTQPNGKPGPNIGEWFALEISANSDLEARARYEDLMGITKHEYQVKVEPVAA